MQHCRCHAPAMAPCVDTALNPLRFQPPSPTSEHRNSNYSCAVLNPLYRRHALFNRGRHLEAFIWRSKVWRPVSLCLRKQRPGSSRTTARTRRLMGAAFNGWTWPDEGRRECRLDRGEVMLVRPSPEERSRAERRHGGAPEGARAGRTARGRLHQVPRLSAPFGALPPQGGHDDPERGSGPETSGIATARIAPRSESARPKDKMERRSVQTRRKTQRDHAA